MKSWADHCSSDEESFNEDTPMDTFDDSDDEGANVTKDMDKKLQVNDDKNHRDHVKEEETSSSSLPPPPPRTYDLPTGPPFTLFVGNLSYSIKDGQQLGDAIAKLVHDRLHKDITVVKGRVSGGNNRGNHGQQQQQQQQQPHKGFGYVEVATLEELKLALELNMDAGARLAGRNVQVDTANHTTKSGRGGGGGGYNSNTSSTNNNNRGSRRSTAPEIDGRQFRGGKFQNTKDNGDDKNNNKNNNAGGGGGGGRGGGSQRHTAGANEQPQGPPPPASQRPSLKLKPRSKPVEDTAGSSQSDIFGGAKPKDTNPWQAKDPIKIHPPAVNKSDDKDSSNQGTERNDRRTSGRGGGGRAGTHAGHDHNNNRRGGQSHRAGRGGGAGAGGAGAGGGGGGSGGKNKDNTNKGRGGHKNTAKKDDKKKFKESTPVVSPAVVVPEKKAEPPKRASNGFAALAFDSDSD